MKYKSIPDIRCAIVHDVIVEFGGAERVLQAFLKIFPNADIYTLIANEYVLSSCFPSLNKKKVFSFLSKNIFRSGSVLQLLSPFLWKRINLEKYDLVISSSSYLMSNTVTVHKPLYIQYILTPPKNLFNLTRKNRLQNIIDYSIFIKERYLKSLQSSPYIISDSIYIKNILRDKFRITSKVIYPPVYIPRYELKKNGEYFLSVSRINKTKNIEKIILACNVLKLPLKITGMGSDPSYEKLLKSLAGPTIEFVGFKTDKELSSLYHSAKGLICASENEDFGISAVEAQAHGVPVIAFHGGGYKETIIPYKTGIFYYKNTVNSLIRTLKIFQSSQFDPQVIYKNAFKFREERFISEMQKYILQVIG